MCSNTGFTCSTFCASAGKVSNVMTVNTGPKSAARTTLLFICLPSFWGNSRCGLSVYAESGKGDAAIKSQALGVL
jgi:hypothetical protein